MSETPAELSAGPAAPPRRYDAATLARHLVQSLTRMRRVTREMVDRGIDERWRFAGLALPGLLFGVEAVVRDIYVPDPWLDAWRSSPPWQVALGWGAVTAAGSVVLAYLVAATLWLVLRVFRFRSTFADLRTAMVASGLPFATFSLIGIALALVGLASDPTGAGSPASLLEAFDIIVMLLAIGYTAVAIAAATGLSLGGAVGAQAVGLVGLVLVAYGAAWVLGYWP